MTSFHNSLMNIISHQYRRRWSLMGGHDSLSMPEGADLVWPIDSVDALMLFNMP
jgi:hypothetical protein